jgi:hypothetical protein
MEKVLRITGIVFPELVGEGNIPMQIAEFELLPKLEGSPIDDLIQRSPQASWTN